MSVVLIVLGCSCPSDLPHWRWCTYQHRDGEKQSSARIELVMPEKYALVLNL